MKSNGSLGKRLAAYSMAAGAAAGLASTTKAAFVHYDNGGTPWFDSCPHFGYGYYDMVLLQMDGTVLVDDSQIDPGVQERGALSQSRRANVHL